MQYQVKITDADYRNLQELIWAKKGIESAAFLLAGARMSSDKTTLLVRRIVQIPDTEYRKRTGNHIELSSRAVNGLAALCEANSLTALLAHSHPYESPYSPSDDYGEGRIAQSLRPYTPISEIGSLLFTPKSIHGRVWTAERPSPIGIDRITIVGRSIKIVELSDDSTGTAGDDFQLHSRQIMAFGKDGQRSLARLKVGIVGVGGTGSSIAEQLVRLGVKKLTVIDFDDLELSNISRVYGSRARDAQFPWWLRYRKAMKKVDVVAKYLRQIMPDVAINAVCGNVTNRDVAELLLDLDVLFACTDEHWGRSIINQIACQYLIPMLNVGMAIKSSEGKLEFGVGNVQLVRPGQGCLWCGGYLDSERIRAESLSSLERDNLVNEGYLGEIDEQAPSVISVTTTIAALAVTWFIQLATDFAGSYSEYSRQNYDLLHGTVRRGLTPSDEACICRLVQSRGDLEPLPL